MPKKKSKWFSIKRSLCKYDSEQLLELIEDLYNLSEENRLFFETRLKRSSTPLKSFKDKIYHALTPDVIENEYLEWDVADKAIQHYKLAAGDDFGITELLVFYVETANQFTLDYGDINEGYYESVEESFKKAIDHLLYMLKKKKNIKKYIARMRAVVKSTDGIGWGYHDALCDMFYEAFGEI